jgi:hypothetical protein
VTSPALLLHNLMDGRIALGIIPSAMRPSIKLCNRSAGLVTNTVPVKSNNKIEFLGQVMKHFVNIFSILLLLLTGTVFVTSPALLLQCNRSAGLVTNTVPVKSNNKIENILTKCFIT